VPMPVNAHSEQTEAMLWPDEIDANGMFIAAWRKT